MKKAEDIGVSVNNEKGGVTDLVQESITIRRSSNLRSNISSNDIVSEVDQVDDKENVNDEIISHKEALKRYARTSAIFCLSRFVGVASEFGAAYMLSRLGNKYLAASGLVTVTNNFIITSSVVSNYATGILQGNFIRSADENDRANVGRMLITSYMYAGGISLVGSILLCFSGNIFNQLGQDPEVTSIVNEYFRGLVMTGGVTFTLLSVSSQQTAYALDRRNLVLGINILRRAVYLGVAYVMIFGKFGCPELGISGLAYARSISSAMDQIIFMLYYRFNSNLIQYQFFKNNVSESLVFIKTFIKKAGMLGAQTLNEFTATIVGMNFIGNMGEDSLSAAEIATQYNSLLKIPVISAMQSTSIELKKISDAPSRRRMGNLAIISSMIIPLIAIPVLCIARNELAHLFMSDDSNENIDKVTEIASNLLILVSVNQISEVVRNISAGSLRGNGRFLAPLLTSIGTISALGIPLSYVFGISLDMRATGVFLSSIISSFLGSAVLLPYWLRSSHSDCKDVVDETTPLFNEAEINDEENQHENIIIRDGKPKYGCCSKFSFWSNRNSTSRDVETGSRLSCNIL